MSRRAQPKQLIPLSDGHSLLQLALARLEGLVPAPGLYICSSREHRQQILEALDGFPEDQYIGEPIGRDTLAAIGVSAAVIRRKHPDAVMAVFTADHLIEPVHAFQQTVARGYELVERHPETLVTFGIEPDSASTGFGYLELAQPWEGDAYSLKRFQEKPDRETAQRFFEAGPAQFLWNSGMFVWRVSTILECIRRYAQDTFARISRIAEAWGTPEREAVLNRMYAELQKISIDYAVMEPASHDPLVRLAALPMRLRWLDVGSWPAFFKALNADERGNAVSGARAVLLETRRTSIASSDPRHLIAAVGCENLIIVHTDNATLVCRADMAETVKRLHASIREKFGDEYI
jgi:mannose-1-phosphate guanylyltransferase